MNYITDTRLSGFINQIALVKIEKKIVNTEVRSEEFQKFINTFWRNKNSTIRYFTLRTRNFLLLCFGKYI